MYIHSSLSHQVLSAGGNDLELLTQKPRKPRLIWKYAQADIDSARGLGLSNFRGCQCVKIHVDYGAMYPKVFST